jgi:hypothetical protein
VAPDTGQALTGWVRFSQVNSKQPVLGHFDFVSEKPIALKGSFEAQWQPQSDRRIMP